MCADKSAQLPWSIRSVVYLSTVYHAPTAVVDAHAQIRVIVGVHATCTVVVLFDVTWILLFHNVAKKTGCTKDIDIVVIDVMQTVLNRGGACAATAKAEESR